MEYRNFLKIIATVLLFIVVITGEASGSKSGGHRKSGKLATPGGKRLSHRGKDILRRLPRETFMGQDEVRSLCEEVCDKTRGVENRGTSTFHRFDPSQKSCICIDKTGALISRSLKKVPSLRPETPSKTVVASKSHILCNDTESFKTCQRFCKQFPKADNYKCSDDGTQCLCFSMKAKSSRTKRQMVIEEVTDTGDELVSLDMFPPTPVMSRTPKYYSRPFGHGPFGGRGCTPYTCIDQCPPGCDSLCRQTQECYCSCPEDLTYEYYDDSIFPSLFG
ncbi:unnamed protein product [Allacma fusca]|uniref:Uncharacterized protein n=1 Tax=Allacma fusca TaxID=39272 RepID=A0A8J2NWW7_9HEXA|nr:unnamed protein product [Allacma fusca]